MSDGYPCPTCGAAGFASQCTTASGRDHVSRRHLESDVEDLRKLIATRDLGFRYQGSRTLRHIWTSEHDRRPLTAREKRAFQALRAAGEIESVHAVGSFGRGHYQLRGLRAEAARIEKGEA